MAYTGSSPRGGPLGRTSAKRGRLSGSGQARSLLHAVRPLCKSAFQRNGNGSVRGRVRGEARP